MSIGGYKIRNKHEIHFVSFSVVGWVDLFTRPLYKNIVLESFQYCQSHKGLNIHGWCIMTNHVHFLAGATNDNLSEILRDLKKFTSCSLLKTIHENERKEMEALKTKSLTAEQFKTQRKDLHNKYKAQMQSVLTPEQKNQMEKFKAERKDHRGKKGEWKKGGKGITKRSGDFQKELNLTQAQKDQLSKMRTDTKGQMESIRNDQSLTQDQKKEKIHYLKKDKQEKFKSVLTKEQLDKLETAKKERKDRVTK